MSTKKTKLPPLPPVPAGYDRWARKGWGWESKGPVGAPWGVYQRDIPSAFNFTNSDGKMFLPSDWTTSYPDCYYIVAVKDAKKPAKKISLPLPYAFRPATAQRWLDGDKRALSGAFVFADAPKGTIRFWLKQCQNPTDEGRAIVRGWVECSGWVEYAKIAKTPEPARCGAGMQAGGKFRTCERKKGHTGKHAASLGGVKTADELPAKPKPRAKAPAKLTAKNCAVVVADELDPFKPAPAPSKVTAKFRYLGNSIPVFVLPGDAASVAQMAEQIREAFFAWAQSEKIRDQTMEEYLLASLGIAAQEGKKK